MKADGLRKLKLKAGTAAVAGGLVWACWAMLLGGCNPISGDYVKNISAAQPDVATAAMNKASEAKSREAIVPLVKRLYDEDPVIRLSAITALENITGENMGYHYYEPEVKRIAAIKLWEAWVEEQNLTEEPPAEGQQGESVD